MLTIEELSVRYGTATAVSGVSFDVGAGELVAIVGSNGAGKSSLGQAVAGLVPATGRIGLGEDDITGTSGQARVRGGIVYVPEGRRVFTDLSVEDNLRAGGFVRRRTKDWRRRLAQMYELAPRLAERANVRAGQLSGGEQQLLAICRALMAHPRVLILDEPSLGLSPRAVDSVTELLTDLAAAEELAVVILEQNVAFASRLAARAWALHLGRFVAELSQEEIGDPELVRDVLMGVSSTD
ncbi:ABC transporter ATP-binding protein [Actinophytocola sp.]|uniref:ABC transporter ATP-binding protein n=1 Tax=Actinophytocola sp. TaxID=1872138 RepID=UPI003D6BA3DC